MKKVMVYVLAAVAFLYAQMPYLPGETVLPEHNLSWTDNYGYSSNIFDEIVNNDKVVVIFWGGAG
ncbi:TPA: hypothetical protein DCR49_01890 [Candidatus Delongbacteria bacterium]|nr:MAG: hypothetical protein A2Y39_05505 [Candidatus Delongbacteria bacterium GWF2_40_14]HAQ60746.1 hypothetical protein [Candidatus Delongbacteria bacterium]